MEHKQKFYREKRWVFFLVFFLLIPLVKSALLMLLWNAILPDLIHVSTINYWQALGLFILCKILFGNFGFGRFGGRNKPFRNPAMREKFMNMSDEDKARIRQEWKERCQK